MRLTIIRTLFAAAFLAVFQPALAVTNGVPDGNRHPYVGMVVQFIPNSDFIWICTSVAVSPTVLLTAGHCGDPSLPVYVSFRPENPDPWSLGPDFTLGTMHRHPDWYSPSGTNDISVIVLSNPVDPGGFAVLPPAELDDSLRMNTHIDVVGYGVQGFVRGGGKPSEVVLLTRYYAPTLLIQSNEPINDDFIKMTSNPGQGKGGACFGDSGGPDLLGGTNLILAINTTLQGHERNCVGIEYSQRVDLPDVLDFINSFLSP
jgi:hypothetical protein